MVQHGPYLIQNTENIDATQNPTAEGRVTHVASPDLCHITGHPQYLPVAAVKELIRAKMPNFSILDTGAGLSGEECASSVALQ